jgi:hypothetical protein
MFQVLLRELVDLPILDHSIACLNIVNWASLRNGANYFFIIKYLLN